jgi:hypothetical protein
MRACDASSIIAIEPDCILNHGLQHAEIKKVYQYRSLQVRVRSIPPWLSGERKRREKRASELAAFITWETRDVTPNHMRAAIGPG